MKTKFNTIIKTVIFTLITLAYSGLSAQTYYTPGQVYTFRNKIDDTHTLQANVLFDAAGNATVTKTIESANSTDKKQSSIFCENERMNLNSETGCASFKGSVKEFWVIDLGSTNEVAVPEGGTTICFSCPCKVSMGAGAGKCKVSDMTDGGATHNITCVVTDTCNECGTLQRSSSKGSTDNNQILIIQANSVNF